MSVRLGKREAVMVARVGDGKRTHALMSGEWRYDSALNMTRCGMNATAVEHLMSGKPLAVTCITCTR